MKLFTKLFVSSVILISMAFQCNRGITYVEQISITLDPNPVIIFEDSIEFDFEINLTSLIYDDGQVVVPLGLAERFQQRLRAHANALEPLGAEKPDEQREKDRGAERNVRNIVKNRRHDVPGHRDADERPHRQVEELAEHDEQHAGRHLPARHAFAAIQIERHCAFADLFVQDG